MTNQVIISTLLIICMVQDSTNRVYINVGLAIILIINFSLIGYFLTIIIRAESETFKRILYKIGNWLEKKMPNN
jgi:hypothetical protein